jgi:hypothetical protein
LFISLHYSTCLSSIFSIEFHISTYFSSIFSIPCHYYLLFLHKFYVFSLFDLPFIHIFHIFSLFDLSFSSIYYNKKKLLNFTFRSGGTTCLFFLFFWTKCSSNKFNAHQYYQKCS